jgi:hypothetical protein
MTKHLEKGWNPKNQKSKNNPNYQNNMKNLKIITILSLILILSSCGVTAKFPVSNVAPAADITIKKQYDKNGNCKISIEAKNLAAADRLTPPKNDYVVWIVSETDGIRNIGKLKIKNAETAGIETLTPFKFSEVFITAEDQGEVSNPAGIEITRYKFK